MRKRNNITGKMDKRSMISDKYDQNRNYPSNGNPVEISRLTDCQ
jgi:hypothetical protein